MAYKHGIYGSEVPTSLIPMTQVNAGLPVVVGTAPVHLAESAAKPNTPVLCYKYDEAVEAFGYSEEWEKYTLCEFMKSHFSLFNVAPVVFINVLDPSIHKETVTDATVTMTDKIGKVNAPVILSTLQVKATADGDAKTLNVDYTAGYDSDGVLVITALDGGSLESATSIHVTYDAVDASKVESSDIVGGVDTSTGAYMGLECVAQVYPKFGLIPGLILAPGWSHNSEVAEVHENQCPF